MAYVIKLIRELSSIQLQLVVGDARADECNSHYNHLLSYKTKVNSISNFLLYILEKKKKPHEQKEGFTIQHLNTTPMVECHSWEYNMTDSLGNTWSSEWNLVCDKKYLKIVAEMIFLIGVASGGIVSGMLSDKFGRKKMLFISAVFQSFFGKYFDSVP